ncbi:MAG: ABC transporter substrate-binding protein [Desulfovibrio sp.]|jgi:phospholipid transport system substrate-binding protein|nr:ABC transporter substrate-binding protein [Desulfovibrio sp.]
MRVAVCWHLSVFSAILLWASCLVLSPAFATENDGAQPRQALTISINRILNCIKHPDYVNPATRAPLRWQIEDEVLHIFDFMEFSSRTVGQRWRSFTPDQQKRFGDAFAELLISTYVNKIEGYNGEQVAYIGEMTSGDRVEVRTFITMKDGKKVPVSYRMLPKDGIWRVYDVLIENISLVKNYRVQFQDILNKTAPDNLIERIRNKAHEVQQQHESK